MEFWDGFPYAQQRENENFCKPQKMLLQLSVMMMQIVCAGHSIQTHTKLSCFLHQFPTMIKIYSVGRNSENKMYIITTWRLNLSRKVITDQNIIYKWLV